MLDSVQAGIVVRTDSLLKFHSGIGIEIGIEFESIKHRSGIAHNYACSHVQQSTYVVLQLTKAGRLAQRWCLPQIISKTDVFGSSRSSAWDRNTALLVVAVLRRRHTASECDLT